jgi:hypothetical protein
VPEETALPEAISGDGGGDDEMKERKRRDEELRIRALKALLTRLEAEEKARKAREEENRKRKVEARAQIKLRAMGVCPAWVSTRRALDFCHNCFDLCRFEDVLVYFPRL